MLDKYASPAGKEGNPSPPKHPPRTCEEWLCSTSGTGHLVSTDGTLFVPSAKDSGAIKWPIHPLHLDYLVAAPAPPTEDGGKPVKMHKKHESPGDTILGTLEEIKEDLKKHARMWI